MFFFAKNNDKDNGSWVLIGVKNHIEVREEKKAGLDKKTGLRDETHHDIVHVREAPQIVIIRGKSLITGIKKGVSVEGSNSQLKIAPPVTAKNVRSNKG